MKTVDKFILKSYLGPMLASFFIVMFIILMNVLWRFIDEFVGKGLPVSAIVEMLFYMTCTLLPLGIPFSTLFAAVMTMGNLGGSNELLALKAAGISLFRIMRSVIIVALLISVTSFFVVNNYVPYSFEKTGNILYDIRNQRQEIKFKDGTFFNGIPDISIRVSKQDPDTRLLTDILIYDTRDRQTAKTIVADSGYIDMVEDNQYLKIILFNGQNYEDKRDHGWYDKPVLRHHTFDRQDLLMELDGFNFEKSDQNIYGDISEAKTMKELSKNIDSLGRLANLSINQAKMEIVRTLLFSSDTLLFTKSDSIRRTDKAFIMNATALDTLTVEMKERIIKDAERKLEQLKYQSQTGHYDISRSTIMLYRSTADWHKKLAVPISVLIFFLIGAPLGAIIRKGGLGIPTIIAVAFFIFYYVISMSGEKMVKDGAWSPEFGMWLPSIILLPIAIFLTYQAVTDSSLLNIDAYYIFFDKHWTKLKARYKIVDKISKIKIKKNHGKSRSKKIDSKHD